MSMSSCTHPATSHTCPLSLHDALPIYRALCAPRELSISVACVGRTLPSRPAPPFSGLALVRDPRCPGPAVLPRRPRHLRSTIGVAQSQNDLINPGERVATVLWDLRWDWRGGQSYRTNCP